MIEQFIGGFRVNWNELDPGSYIRSIPALKNLDDFTINNNITFFVGENGTGKSTLLEALAVAYGFNPEGGNKNFNFETAHTHSELYEAITLLRGYRKPKDGFFLRAESFYNMASQLDRYEAEMAGLLEYYGGKSLHQQSHGESFLALIQNRFTENSLYLLDEPEAALSPQRQLTLFVCIAELAGKNAQFIIATHSPILLGIPGADIISFNGEKLQKIAYEETESYQTTEMFINNREYLIRHLLSNA